MKAAVIHGPSDVRMEDVADPVLRRPTDAIVRVLMSCICGSDLWAYRADPERFGAPQRIGHEFVGVVEEVGSDVGTVGVGDVVIAPFMWSDGTCELCRAGIQTSCLNGGGWGGEHPEAGFVDGGQSEAIRVPFADGTLVRAGVPADDDRMLALLTLSDVMGTGHHAALAAGVEAGSTVAVIGDGAVGLCGVLASARLGAERIVLFGRHETRIAVGRRFGATDVVPDRDDEAVRRAQDLTDGLGFTHVLECVGTQQSWSAAFGVARPGATIGYVGVPAGVTDGLPLRRMFSANINVRGGVAPVRAYLPDLLADVLAGTLDPAPVFDLTLSLADTPQGYRLMDQREAIKVALQP